MRNTLRITALAALLASTAMVAANAAPVTFFGEDLSVNGPPTPNSDAARNSFFANLVGVGTETFDSLASGTGTPIGAIFAGAGTATITGSGSVTNSVGAGRFPISAPNYYTASTGDFLVTFSSPIAAFGFFGTDIGDYGAQLSLTLTDTNGNTTDIVVPHTVGSNGSTNGSAIYFGFYDTATQYVSVAFNNSVGQGDIFGFDNMSVGSLQQVVPTPEPISMALFGVGLAGLGFAARRRKA